MAALGRGGSSPLQRTLRPAWTALDAVRARRYLTNTCSPTRRNRGADPAAAGDLGLRRRLCRRARLPADRTRDRRGCRARVSLDRARASCEPRAARVSAARPDEAARPRARPAASADREERPSRERPAPAARPDRSWRAAARRPVHRGLPGVPGRSLGAARVPPPREGRLDDRRRHPRRRLRVVRRQQDAHERRHRRRARRRGRGGRRGDRQALLPRRRPDPPSARERALEPIYAEHVQLLGKVVGCSGRSEWASSSR